MVSPAVTPAPGRSLPVIVERAFRPMIYWYVSLRCNLACKHCWVNSSPSVDTTGELNSREMLLAVDRMAEFGAASVLITGGEPLLRPDIGLILAKLTEYRLPTHIETNAMLVTDDIVQLADQARQVGSVLDFAVSLDGGTAEAHDWCRGRGGFVGTVAGLRRLSEAGLTFDIQCVVTRRNWSTLPQLAALASELGARNLNFVLASPVGRANHFVQQLSVPYDQTRFAVDKIFEAIREYPGRVAVKIPPAMIPPTYIERFRGLDSGSCVSNVVSCSFPLLGVLPDGSVTVCAATRKSPEAFFGNIRSQSLVDIWRNRRLDELREQYVAAQELTGICGDCVFRSSCRGACRAHAFAESGSFNAPYPVCAELERVGRFPALYRSSTLRALGVNR